MNTSTVRPPATSPPMPTRPRVLVPVDLCDAHVHVFDPAHFPYAATRRYTPPEATRPQLQRVMQQLGTGRVVVVQPSCYGEDNAAVMDALHTIGAGQARGVVVIDAVNTSAQELHEMHERGVRGVRLNASVDAQSDKPALIRRITAVQQAAAHLGWHVQMFVDVRTVVAMADELAGLSIPLVLDHFGGLDADALAPTSGALDVLLDLLRHGNTYIKLSAPYRVVSDPDSPQLADAVRRFADTAPERLLWASDWPHTGGAGSRGSGAASVEAFRDENAALALERLYQWIPDAANRQRILVSNPARLYGFNPSSVAPRN
jgi:predicted TIM-barrel fold metal-dependent hydrolase